MTVSGQAGTDLVLGGLSVTNTLMFTTLNWGTAQTVTVTARDDVDGVDDPVTLTHTAVGGDYGGVTTELAVTVIDDDRAVVIAPDVLEVVEGDAAGTAYTVKLAAEPAAAVTVTVSGQAGTDLVLGGLSVTNTLMFTTLNWGTAQTVTVTARDDVDGVDDPVTLTHTAVGGDYGGVTTELAVTVIDDDRAVVIAPDVLEVVEGDAAGTAYTVKLATQPAAAVTVTVAGQAGTDLVLGGLSVTNTLTFTTLNWGTAQTVTVTARDDVDGADDPVTLTHTAVGGDYGGVTTELAVTVIDDDRGVVLSSDVLEVVEGDAAGTAYTVKLATQPTAAVTVTVAGQAGTDLVLGGLSVTNTLTFTTLNWGTAQTVTVTARDDTDGVDDPVTLTHTAVGGDYGGVTTELAVTVVDDDRAVVIAPDVLEVAEGDAAGTAYTVKLATEPAAAVTVTVAGHAGTDLVLGGLSVTNTLTFTTLNWGTAQTVTVTARDDVDGVDDPVTLTHTAVGGDYGGVTAGLAVTVIDDDRAVVIAPDVLEVAEGDAAGTAYTVKLATQPAAAVTVTVSGQAGTDLVLGGLSVTNTLTFTTLNWGTAQTVTVTARDDTDGVDDPVTLTHTAVGGDYGGVTTELAVTVIDDDRAVVIAPDVLEVVEGDAAGTAYTVKLATQPAAAVTVTVSGQAGTIWCWAG